MKLDFKAEIATSNVVQGQLVAVRYTDKTDHQHR